jgi:hypothetical protein
MKEFVQELRTGWRDLHQSRGPGKPVLKTFHMVGRAAVLYGYRTTPRGHLALPIGGRYSDENTYRFSHGKLRCHAHRWEGYDTGAGLNAGRVARWSAATPAIANVVWLNGV